MDDLIADFTAECREMLEALGGEIVAWEAQPDDRARLDSIFRFVHTPPRTHSPTFGPAIASPMRRWSRRSLASSIALAR
jgi:hypothetical protein